MAPARRGGPFVSASDAIWCCSASDGDDLWYNTVYPESKWIGNWLGIDSDYANAGKVYGQTETYGIFNTAWNARSLPSLLNQLKELMP